jgi:hypothetical protein
MSRTLRALLFVVVLTAALCAATSASARPTQWAAVDVTLHSESGGGVMVVAGHLPEATALPAEAELSVPKGSSLVWIGEVLGGPLAEDPSLTYAKSTRGEADVYLVTLTRSRTAQIEVVAAPFSPTGPSGYTASLAWPTAGAVPEVTAAIRVPAGAQVTTGSAGTELTPGDATYDYYATTAKDVKAGGSVRLSLTFTAPAVAPVVGAAASASGSDTILWVVLLLALVAGVVLVVVAVAVSGTRRGALAQGFAGADEDEPLVATAPLSDGDGGEGAEEVPAPRNPAATRRAIATAAVVVVFVLVAVIVGVETNKPRVTGDTVSRTFAGGEACATASIALAVPAGADPAATAQSLFDALKPVPSITTVTYSIRASTVEVGYCESSSSEAALREALAPTGLVSATQ